MCSASRPKSGKSDNTPVRFNNVTTRPQKRQALQSPPGAETTAGASINDIRIVVQEILQNEIQALTSNITASLTTAISIELKSVKDEIRDMKTSMDFINAKFESISKEHEEARKEIFILKSDNNTMKATIKNLTAQVNMLEQNARASNLEIQCVPEKKSENIVDIVTKIGEVINIKIKKDDISHCTRIAKLNRNSNRPRSVVVHFNSTRIRDEYLAASINFNRKKPVNEKLNTSHIGFVGEKFPIFISEHLSPANKALHAAARLAAKDKGYKYVWVKNGRVYMRKNDESDYLYIRDIDSLSNIK